MKLSQTAMYAIKATLQLARTAPDTCVSASRLAQQGGIPARFLLQILRRLVEHEVLHSTRGVTGGYVLARSPSQITLLDIVTAVENPENAKALVPRGLSRDTRARLIKVLQLGTQSANAELSKVTLADLDRQKRKARKRR